MSIYMFSPSKTCQHSISYYLSLYFLFVQKLQPADNILPDDVEKLSPTPLEGPFSERSTESKLGQEPSTNSASNQLDVAPSSQPRPMPTTVVERHDVSLPHNATTPKEQTIIPSPHLQIVELENTSAVSDHVSSPDPAPVSAITPVLSPASSTPGPGGDDDASELADRVHSNLTPMYLRTHLPLLNTSLPSHPTQVPTPVSLSVAPSAVSLLSSASSSAASSSSALSHPSDASTMSTFSNSSNVPLISTPPLGAEAVLSPLGPSAPTASNSARLPPPPLAIPVVPTHTSDLSNSSSPINITASMPDSRSPHSSPPNVSSPSRPPSERYLLPQGVNKRAPAVYWPEWLLWLAVLLLYAGNVLFRFAALALVPLSTIAPLSSLTIGANTLLAKFYFGERLNLIGIIGTVLVIAGCVVAVVVGYVTSLSSCPFYCLHGTITYSFQVAYHLFALTTNADAILLL